MRKRTIAKNIIAGLLLGWGALLPAWAADNMTFRGALVAEPCVIPPGQETVVLNFGSIVDKYLYQNLRSPGVQFEIILAECDLSVGKTVRMTLNGTESLALPGLLAPAGQAGGIGIGLETLEGQTVAINHSVEKLTLAEGTNGIRLLAYVRGEPEAIANKTIGHGAFSAVATFNLEYE
ncbi:TPA: type 1 fimbrial protein [Serratia marcescens]|uniref:fimbrial protein n=1 Tax=Serratia sp. CY29653 TaxID=3383594 RepID=UPI001A298622|nr:type 1 fimbrial protein [Serratia marcescens]HAT4976646.1 type 1 fimbrial protein [Serratia marcescens]HAT4990632.1 type 1 fimbrial protein [Serratia marcescens]HAT5049271.1 type 1 fimbrial protein [Serratia marcescens]HEJ7079749.1 type 1 fimbrial protein [Serratia marcescens]